MSRFRPAGFRNGRTAWRRASRPVSGRPARRRSTAFRDGWNRIAAGLTEARCASERGLANGRRAPRGAPLHGGRQRQIRGSVPSHGARVLEVRIHLPPAKSHANHRFLDFVGLYSGRRLRSCAKPMPRSGSRPPSRVKYHAGTTASSRLCLACWSNIARLLNTGIIVRAASGFAPSSIDTFGGLSHRCILRTPPAF